MPTLEFGDYSTQAGRYWAQIAVRSVMGWPGDEEKRKQYVATVMARNLGMLELDAANIPDPAKAGDWSEMIKALEAQAGWETTFTTIKEWFNSAGGFLAVADAPGLSHYGYCEEEPAGLAAGLILAMIWRMAEHHTDLPGGASVNKAVFILGKTPGLRIPRNNTDLRKAWAIYKPVAHFYAALWDFYIGAAVTGSVHNLQDEFDRFLALAEAYEKFGINYTPPRARVPILDEAETWRLPDNKPWDPIEIIVRPFTSGLLDAARTYRAPIAGA